MLLGELIATTRATGETVRQQTASIESLSVTVHASTQVMSKLEDGLTHANNDIMRLSKTVLTAESLRAFGLHAEDAAEHKIDLTWVRAGRIREESNSPIRAQIKSAMAVLIMSAIITTAWGAFAPNWTLPSSRVTIPTKPDKPR